MGMALWWPGDWDVIMHGVESQPSVNWGLAPSSPAVLEEDAGGCCAQTTLAAASLEIGTPGRGGSSPHPRRPGPGSSLEKGLGEACDTATS